MPPQLETLVASNNKLTKICDSISKLANLKSLDISYNKITECSNIKHLTKLTVLNISHNELNNLDSFDSLISLKECDLRFNKFDSWLPFKNLACLISVEAIILEGNPILTYFSRFSITKNQSISKDTAEIENIIQRLKFYPQCGLLCSDSKVRRKYEDRKSDRKLDSGTADYSSESSSEISENEEQDKTNDLQQPSNDENNFNNRDSIVAPVSAKLKEPPPIPKTLNASMKQPFAFKLDLSKCKFDRTKESPVEIELSILFEFIIFKSETKWKREIFK